MYRDESIIWSVRFIAKNMPRPSNTPKAPKLIRTLKVVPILLSKRRHMRMIVKTTKAGIQPTVRMKILLRQYLWPLPLKLLIFTCF